MMPDSGITWYEAWAVVAALALAGAGWAIWWRVEGRADAAKTSV